MKRGENMTEEENISQLPDEEGESLTNSSMTIKDYADSIGQTYESVRKKVAKLKNDPEYKSHIFVSTDPITSQPKTYIDKHVQDYLASKRRSDPVVVDTGEETIKELKRQLDEMREDRDRQRDEKELYMKKLLEIQENPEKSIDSTRYMLIEDHKKVEEELKVKEQVIEELKKETEAQQEENKQIKKEKEELQSAAIKTAHLISEVRDELKEVKDEKKSLEDLKKQIEEEKQKEQKENEELHKKLAKAEDETIEFLQLGFFARRKKLKELKAKKQTEE